MRGRKTDRKEIEIKIALAADWYIESHSGYGILIMYTFVRSIA